MILKEIYTLTLEDNPYSITAIIITKNYGSFISDAISSVVSQTLLPQELIIVDDGSTDNTQEVVEKFVINNAWIKHHLLSPSGIAASRNFGISVSKGNWIAFLDADDMWEAHKLSIQMNFLINNPEFTSTTYQTIKCEKNHILPPQYEGMDITKPMPNFGTGSLMASKKTFLNVGPFDESLIVQSDADWLFRAKKLKVEHHILIQPLLIRRLHNQNNSNVISGEQRKKNREALLKRHFG